MTTPPHFLMTDASLFDVTYQINPWMRPEVWAADRSGGRAAASAASQALQQALEEAGAIVELIPAEPGLPDLVFPANAAVVLDGRALMSRFRCPERQGEQPVLLRFFKGLRERGLIEDVESLPAGVFHEGAGDAIWDAARGHFWAGYGQRSSLEAADIVERIFDRPAVRLELASPRFYHLDTCFCPLSGGEVLYYPPAFTPLALGAIRSIVPPELRIEASDAEAAALCVNAVNVGRQVILARAPASLRVRLVARDYDVEEIDLAPFLLSGGAAYCLTLRLDRTSTPALAVTG